MQMTQQLKFGSNAQKLQARRSSVVVRSSNTRTVYAAAAVQTKTLKIGTRGSPLALAQAYLTRDLLKVRFK